MVFQIRGSDLPHDLTDRAQRNSSHEPPFGLRPMYPASNLLGNPSFNPYNPTSHHGFPDFSGASFPVPPFPLTTT